jgi:hypothetical protein
MRVFSIRPCPSGGSAVATFNVAINEDIKIFNARLHRKQDGTYRVYAPQAGGARVVTFSESAVRTIVEAAMAELKEPCAYERNHAA